MDDFHQDINWAHLNLSYSQNEDYVIFCIYSFCSKCTKRRNFVKEESRKPKRVGKLKSHFVICISRGKVDERQTFSLA